MRWPSDYAKHAEIMQALAELQSVRRRLAAYGLSTDEPRSGVVEVADLVDAACSQLASARL